MLLSVSFQYPTVVIRCSKETINERKRQTGEEKMRNKMEIKFIFVLRFFFTYYMNCTLLKWGKRAYIYIIAISRRWMHSKQEFAYQIFASLKTKAKLILFFPYLIFLLISLSLLFLDLSYRMLTREIKGLAAVHTRSTRASCIGGLKWSSLPRLSYTRIR